MRIYMHIETGSTDYKDGWILHYSSYELSHRGIDGKTAFEEDLEEGRFVEVCGHCELAEVFDEGLCHDCFDELNRVDSDDFIGYRKGE